MGSGASPSRLPAAFQPPSRPPTQPTVAAQLLRDSRAAPGCAVAQLVPDKPRTLPAVALPPPAAGATVAAATADRRQRWHITRPATSTRCTMPFWAASWSASRLKMQSESGAGFGLRCACRRLLLPAFVTPSAARCLQARRPAAGVQALAALVPGAARALGGAEWLDR